MTTDDGYMDAFGPIDFLVVEFAGGSVGVDGFTRLLALVDQQVIRVLDLEFVEKRDDGSTARIEAQDLNAPAGLDLAMLDGASSGILTPEDFDEIGESMTPGSVAAILVYEELSMLPVIASWEREGATLLNDGFMLVEDLEAALDATDS